jgi:hypothetical protein
VLNVVSKEDKRGEGRSIGERFVKGRDKDGEDVKVEGVVDRLWRS